MLPRALNSLAVVILSAVSALAHEEEADQAFAVDSSLQTGQHHNVALAVCLGLVALMVLLLVLVLPCSSPLSEESQDKLLKVLASVPMEGGGMGSMAMGGMGAGLSAHAAIAADAAARDKRAKEALRRRRATPGSHQV